MTQPDVPTRRFSSMRWKIHTYTLVFIAACTCYLIVPFLLQGEFCPVSTFKFGSDGSIVSLVAGVVCACIAAVVCLTPLSTTSASKPGSPGQTRPATKSSLSRIVVFTAAGLLMLGSIAIWLEFTGSYFCLTPSAILLRAGPLRMTRTLGWQEVTEVRARCGRDRSGLWGGLVVTLATGDELSFQLNGATRAAARSDYNNMQRALDGYRHRYVIAESVTQDQCPAVEYTLLRGPNG